ncbi:MAG TPA: hypothetical protein VFN78_11985 [Ktedonobacterales bacterium]|nr:hypothetical protein [Ktedonobacterales bacterium]
MYKFRRLRALLQALTVTKPGRPELVIRWSFIFLAYLVTLCFVLFQLLKTSHDWPVRWQDVSALDATGRSFLIGSYAALMTGVYSAAAMIYALKGASSRIVPPPALAEALRRAARDRAPRLGAVVQAALPDQTAPGAATEETGDVPEASLVVVTPELLTRPLPLVFAVTASGIVSLALIAGLASFLPVEFAPQQILGATGVYLDLRFIGVLAGLGAFAFAFAWRMWHGRRVASRGIEVTSEADGLTVRVSGARKRQRFISWRDAQSLVRFAYNDYYVRPCTVYLLDAGSQTFLWESPPDMRYASPAQRAQLAAQRASAARLASLASAATGLPLFDISGVINSVAKLEPAVIYTPPQDNEPSAEDMELLESIESIMDTKAGAPATPAPTMSAQWLRLLTSMLIGFATMVGAAWLAQGLVH